MTDRSQTQELRLSLPILIGHGTVELSGLGWELTGNRRATNQDLRSIASLLVAAAYKLEQDPSAVDTRIEA